MSISFHKYQAIGNDFIIIDELEKTIIEEKAKFAKKYCMLKTGIGADGVLFLSQSKNCDFKMRIFNADGSEAEMCGNGIRCLAKYIKDHKLTEKSEITIETLAGSKNIFFSGENISVSMGKPTYSDELKSQVLKINDKQIETYFVNTGVPHVVIFENYTKEIARKIRFHDKFQPKGTNVNFVTQKGDILEVKTYERGVEDFTLSCGTGSSASALVTYLLNKRSLDTVVKTDGGTLTIKLMEKDHEIIDIILSGQVEHIFSGEIM